MLVVVAVRLGPVIPLVVVAPVAVEQEIKQVLVMLALQIQVAAEVAAQDHLLVQVAQAALVSLS
jgi:hypothetical protein